MEINKVLAVQALGMVGIFLFCFIGALIPIRLTKWFKDQAKVLSLSNCLGAGVLLGASYVHLMTDAEGADEDASNAYVSDRADHFLVAIGFLGSFILEKVLFEHEHEHPGGGHSHGGHGDEHVIHIETFTDDIDEDQTEMTEIPLKSESEDDRSEKEEEKSLVRDGTEVDEEEGAVKSKKDKVHKRKKKEHHHHHNKHGEEGHEHEVEVNVKESSDGHETLMVKHNQLPIEEGGEHHDHIIEHTHSRKRKVPYMLFVVLGLESAVSGCALGFQNDFMGALVLFIAIASHIWAEAFTLCTALLKAKIDEGTIIKAMLGFSLITPFATLIGLAMSYFMEGLWVEILSSILIAFAAGTFIFVANMEIMAEEFASPHNRWMKLCFLLVGFFFMGALGFVF